MFLSLGHHHNSQKRIKSTAWHYHSIVAIGICQKIEIELELLIGDNLIVVANRFFCFLNRKIHTVLTLPILTIYNIVHILNKKTSSKLNAHMNFVRILLKLLILKFLVSSSYENMLKVSDYVLHNGVSLHKRFFFLILKIYIYYWGNMIE